MVDVTSFLATAQWVIFALVVIVVFSGLVYYFMYLSKFNKKIFILDPAGGGNILREDKAREFYDDKGILCWKFLKEKIVQACPPQEATLVSKGKKIAFITRMQGDQYSWVNVSDFKKDAMTLTGKYFIIPEDAKRQLADQLRKAERERTTKLNEMLQTFLPIIIIGITFVGMYFIYDVISTNMVTMSENLAGASASLERASVENREVLEKAQEILQARYEETRLIQNVSSLPRAPN